MSIKSYIILFLCFISFSIVANAQASGGQIIRNTSSKTPSQISKNNNSRSIENYSKVFANRDECFNRDEKLQASGPLNTSYSELQFILLPEPDFDGHILEMNRGRKQISLKQISCKGNSITDFNKWVEENNIQTNREQNGFGINIGVLDWRFRIKTDGYHVLLLGINYSDITKVIVTDEDETILYAAYDFENFRKSPKRDINDDYSGNQHISDVIIEDGIMYVAHGGSTYSSTYGKQTGYITAINLFNNEILWTSVPLTNNSRIAIANNSLITGYGFTNEPDYLYVLDKYSGQRVQKIPLKKAPDYIVVKDQIVYVRTYSYDYTFSIQ